MNIYQIRKAENDYILEELPETDEGDLTVSKIPSDCKEGDIVCVDSNHNIHLLDGDNYKHSLKTLNEAMKKMLEDPSEENAMEYMNARTESDLAFNALSELAEQYE